MSLCGGGFIIAATENRCSVSGHSVCLTFKRCQIVAGTSMIHQFHEFLNLIFGGFLQFGPAVRQGLSYACSWHSWRSLKASSSISAASHLVALCFAAQAAALALHAPLCAHGYEKAQICSKIVKRFISIHQLKTLYDSCTVKSGA